MICSSMKKLILSGEFINHDLSSFDIADLKSCSTTVNPGFMLRARREGCHGKAFYEHRTKSFKLQNM